MSRLLVIIPCYNEAQRLNIPLYKKQLVENLNVDLLFVDDGSEDNTINKIQELQKLFINRINYLSKLDNTGKADAVYNGFWHLQNNSDYSSDIYQYVGYIDADLAVSINEINRIAERTILENKCFGFGSRWKRIGSHIERKLIRHYVGRIFATIASELLEIGVYDTQCGAKVFKREIADDIFKNPFNVNWAFDVEIFFRILKIFPKEEIDKYCIEIPLKNWRDVEGSKVKLTDSIKVINDIWTLKRIYR